MLLRLRAVALQVVELASALEKVRVVRVHPERSLDIALARHQAHKGTAVAGGGLKQGPFAGAVTELDALAIGLPIRRSRAGMSGQARMPSTSACEVDGTHPARVRHQNQRQH
ncbi:MAG: hypothetical protein IT514_06980 [Burkholderiales bacterium]|nr:hypothetical protein [Burkholderiales bacterium]